MSLRRIAILCTCFFACIIAVMSRSSRLKTLVHTQGVFHPWFHLLAFTVVTALAMFCSPRPAVRVVLLLGLLVFAWGTEYHEHLVNGYPVEENDVQLDALGVGLGAAIGWAVTKRTLLAG